MLSRLGITASDIKLIEESDATYVPKNLFYFKNRINGHSITSINNSLDDLKELININDWYRVDVL